VIVGRKIASRGFLGLVMAFLLLPAVVVAAASFTESKSLQFPPEGFSLKWYEAALNDEGLVDAFWFSVKLALVTGIIATVLGTLVAFALVRFTFPGKHALEAFAMGPLTLPRVVLGLSMLQVFGQIGIGSSFWTLLSGHVLIATPFAIRLVTAGLGGVGRTYERAAMSLGASYPSTLRHVTLPMAKTGIVGAFVFASIVSFEDVAMTIFLSGIGTTTVPVKLYTYTEFHNTPLLTAVSTILVLAGFLSLLVIHKTIGMERAFGTQAE
jgi:putative spermidine/putrescine transport system permease protein